MKQDRVDTDPLFARLQQQADATTAGNGSEDADMPAPRVWLAIQEANQRRKKRRAVWMFLGLTSGLFLTMLWWRVPGAGQTTVAAADKDAVEALGSAAKSIEKEQVFSPKSRQLSENQGSKGLDKPQGQPQMLRFENPSRSTQNPKKSLLSADNDFGPDRHLPARQPGIDNLPPLRNPAMPIAGSAAMPAVTTPIDRISLLEALQAPKYPTLSINTLATPDLTLVVSEKARLKNEFRKQVQLTLQTGLFLTALKLKTGETGELPNGQERAALSWQQGLGVGLLLNPHWALETGLQFSTHHISATRESNLIFKTNEERFDPLNQVYTGTVKQELQTSFGEVEMRYDINRIAGQPVIDQTEVKVAIETDERVHYLRVPVALCYRRHFGPALICGLQAGTGVNLLTGYRFQVAQSNTQLPEIRSINARNLNQARGLTQVLLDAQLGLSGQLALTPRWQLLLHVEARHGLQSMYQNAGFKSYPVAIGLHLGLNCQLTN